MKKAFVPVLVLAVAMAGCDNGTGGTGPFSTADTVSVYALPADQVRLVKTASMRCQVADVLSGVDAVAEMAREAGGLVTSQQVDAGETGRRVLRLSADSMLVVTAYAPVARLTVRVPAPVVDTFLALLAGESQLVASSRLSVDDRSLAYLGSRLRQQSRNAVLAPVKAVKVKEASALIAEKEVAIDERISNLELDAQARFSTVDVELFQDPVVRRQRVADGSLAGIDLPWTTRMADALSTGWSVLGNIIVAVAHAWVLVPLGLLGWVAYRGRRRKLLKTA
ncbi:MAG: hypothetical protein JWP27_117 [Flaviaesturariibacter sp.]|nr:hypothetical protein [Flaviaesturariibacter sp.]